MTNHPKEPIKVFHFITSLSRGGRERQLATIVKHTDQDRFSSKIIYFNKTKSDYIQEYGLSEHCIHIKQVKFFPRLIELNRLIKVEKPDILYTWGNLESVFILLILHFHRFKFINGSIRHGIRSKRFSHYFRSLILHLSKNIVANSNAGLTANNLKKGNVLYNGIADKFIGMIGENEKIIKRKQLPSMPENAIVLISIANLVPYKDYFSVLNSLKLVKEKGYEFYYLILGDGPLRDSVEKVIYEHKLNENVLLLGNIQQVNEYIKIADLFIHSSKGEGCSNAILEAMAAGLPVIASNTGGTSEIVDKGSGFLFEYKNVGQLTEIIMKCLDNKFEMRKMGIYSYERIKENFTINRMMQNYYGIISNVAQ